MSATIFPPIQIKETNFLRNTIAECLACGKQHLNRLLTCTSFKLNRMIAHRYQRKSNRPRSTSKSRDGHFKPSASDQVPTWHLLQTEPVYPCELWGFPVRPLSRRIYRRWEALR